MGGGMGGGGIEPLSRSVFIRKLAPTVTLEELVNEVGVYGAIDSFRIDAERREAYVNFVDGQSAAALLEERPGIIFPGQTLAAELTWGKKKALSPELANAISQGATRNLYIGNLPEGATQEMLMEKFLPAVRCFVTSTPPSPPRRPPAAPPAAPPAKPHRECLAVALRVRSSRCGS